MRRNFVRGDMYIVWFEGFVYAYWEKFDLWRIVDCDFRQNGPIVKNEDFFFSISESFVEGSIIWGSHVGKRRRCVSSIPPSFQYSE